MGGALQKGLVDGLGIDRQAANDWRIDKVGRDVLSLPLGAVTFCIVMNEGRFPSFPEPVRAMIDQTSADLGRRIGQALDRAEAEAEAWLRPTCNLTEPDPADAARFRAIMAACRDIWPARTEARGLPARECYQRLQTAVAQAEGRA